MTAYGFWIAMLGTTLPTPLYPLYEKRFGFSALIITVIFATYAVGVIAALVLLGGLSDVTGRKPVMIAGLGLSALSAVLFLIARGLAPMLIARAMSGLSAGLFTGTGTAALADIAGEERRTSASGAATASNLGGLGCGTLLAGSLAAWAVLPLRLPFWVDLALLLPAVAGVMAIREPRTHRSDAALRIQRLRVPREVRATFVPAAIAGFASFAMSGLFSAVTPSFLAKFIGLSSPALAGSVVFALFFASAVGQLAVSRVAGAALRVGCIGVVLGAVFVGAGLAVESLTVLLVGAIVAGLGQGLSVGGGIDALNAQTPADCRGEVASSFFVVLYFALSIPIVGVGLVAQAIDLRSAALGFTALVALIAAGCLVALILRGTAGPAGRGQIRPPGRRPVNA